MRTSTILVLSNLLTIQLALAQAEPAIQAESQPIVKDSESIEIDSIGAEKNTSSIMSIPVAVHDSDKDESAQEPHKRSFVIVPIPVSNPTFDTGLILGGAYFYRQSEAQQKVQPASVTGAAAFYSSNKSSALGVAHQTYWSENRWRFNGMFGHVDLKLGLLTKSDDSNGLSIDWFIDGEFITAEISRKVAGGWYAGAFSRYIDLHQRFAFGVSDQQFNIDTDTKSVGLGLKLEYDNRDKPFNSYSGSIFRADVLFNGSTIGSDVSYKSYSLRYRSYHSISSTVVLAWEGRACNRSGTAPLWDTCKVNLRGFSTTDFMGKSSAIAQLEARWRMHRKWGVVAFAGGGYYKNSFSEIRNEQVIPSYGIGLRYMVLESQRINLRLDYARSVDSNAIYFSVGESF